MVARLFLKGTITLQFWGILPTMAIIVISTLGTVPLHYSSGASFQLAPFAGENFGTVPLHYSSGASFQQKGGGEKAHNKKSTITLQFWGILPTFFLSGITRIGECTITLQFWGILPTPPLRF